MKFKKKIDHLVYSVFDLEKAMSRIEQKLGIRPQFGGYHKTQGTKNALLNLGEECYLELLAIDATNKEIQPPRWMGIDHPEMGIINGGSRKTDEGSMLTWELTMPLPAPEVELVPFLIDWKNEENHPTKTLPKLCKLLKLYATHPTPTILESTFEKLGVEIELIKSNEISIKATIEGPNGILEL